MLRRAFVVALVAVAVTAGCKKEERCQKCGMKIDMASPWRAELVTAEGTKIPFDTPRCALDTWKNGKAQARSLRVQEYYDRTWRDAEEVRFMVGGDVQGPMGPDLVPVDPSRATKFVQDHSAERYLTLAEVTPAVISGLK